MKRKNVTTQMMKEYIAESLLLLMRGKPYADISIGEITAKAGVNRSTYYRNFANKEAVVEFWFAGVMGEYLTAFRNASDTSPNAYLTTIFECFYAHKDELLAVHRDGLAHLILGELNRIFDDERLSDGERYRRYFHTGGIYNFLALWLSQGMGKPPDVMTRIAAACFPNGELPMLLTSEST